MDRPEDSEETQFIQDAPKEPEQPVKEENASEEPQFVQDQKTSEEPEKEEEKAEEEPAKS